METASTTPSSTPPVTVDAPSVDAPVPVIDPTPHDEGPKMGSMGSVLAILLIVLLLVIGAFYVWGQRLSEGRQQQVLPSGQ